MDWIQVLIILGTYISLFVWNRTESRADIRHFETEIRGWKDEINKEMKDFHGRICAMNEKSKHPLKEEKKGK